MSSTSILRLRDVLKRTGLARSTLYLRMAQGLFPKPISLGFRSVGWLESEVDLWIDNLIAKSRGAQAACSDRTAAPAFNASR
jgi:prophage regulatory protein